MSTDDPGWISARFARLPTGLKMLLILSLALLPLGLIAVIASIESARDNWAERRQSAVAQLQVAAQRLNSAISRSGVTVTASSEAVSLSPPGSAICISTLQRLYRTHALVARYALYASNGELRCATPGYVPPKVPWVAEPGPPRLSIAADGSALGFVYYDERGRLQGAGEFSREALARLILADVPRPDFDLELAQEGRRMILNDSFEDSPLKRTVSASAPVGEGRLELRMARAVAPVSLAELLMILLPVMMWLAAALISWVVPDRFLLRPLLRMQKAVSAYRPGDRQLSIPPPSSPAREIGELGQAFERVTETVASHEAELEAAVERQRRLVREVHHRVKNNLQVVASLLNLHSRGTVDEDVAAAYASIQRRVDALAFVHRNHYAELEESRGVSLRALISELAANLRATAPPSAAGMAIALDLETFYVTQDVAVSVAFLVTEMVEFAMLCCGGEGSIAISMREEQPGKAMLTIHSESLKAGIACDERLFARFDRIVTGLARQLRSPLHRDPETGSYAIEISVLERADEAA